MSSLSGKCGNNLFDATSDNNIHAWMQMINYHAFLKGHAPNLEGELKLRGARHMGCPKKIVEAMNILVEAHGVGIQVSHLEGEKVFGSTKRKLNVPIGDCQALQNSKWNKQNRIGLR